MGFGGSAQAMITAIKNNEKMRRQKRERFKKQIGGYGSLEKTEYNLPKATPEQLNAIRIRMKKERRQWLVKVTTLTIIGFVLLIGIIVFVFAWMD